MANSAQKVLHELTAAGLLSADRATEFGEELETGAEALLSRLVADGHITQFQADKLLIGQSSDIYFGDYVVLDKLGQGGMGTVFLAKHRRMDRKVAIKVLPVTVLDSEAAVARFYQEVKVAAQLTHPNIVHAYDAGEHHGFQYLVMEYVAGHDLAQVLAQLGPIPPALALDYLTQACAGLEYAHRKGIVHRDIKPSNLLLDDEGTIKVLDMGLARLGGPMDGEASAHLTTTGQMMGTVEYMSPEQAEDTRMADARSDIYSLGCTLYRLVTGVGPFTRDTVVKTILAHRDAPIPVIETGTLDDASLNRLFQKMVAKDPNDRFQSTTLLSEALRRIESGEELPSIEPPPAPAPSTAVAYRVTEQQSRSGFVPEAIIPDEAPMAESVVPTSSQASRTPSDVAPPNFDSHPETHSTSEVVYIKDDSLQENLRGILRAIPSILLAVIRTFVMIVTSAVGWVFRSPETRILLRGILSVLLSGTVAWILGPLTWRAANRKLRNAQSPPQHRWMLIVGKFLSIASILLSFIVVIVLIITDIK